MRKDQDLHWVLRSLQSRVRRPVQVDLDDRRAAYKVAHLQTSLARTSGAIQDSAVRLEVDLSGRDELCFQSIKAPARKRGRGLADHIHLRPADRSDPSHHRFRY